MCLGLMVHNMTPPREASDAFVPPPPLVPLATPLWRILRPPPDPPRVSQSVAVPIKRRRGRGDLALAHLPRLAIHLTMYKHAFLVSLFSLLLEPTCLVKACFLQSPRD